MPPVPPVTKALLLACGLVYVLQLVLGEVAMLPFMLWPAGDYALGTHQGQMITVGFLPWQLFTYGFMHGSETHLLFNLLALWMLVLMSSACWGRGAICSTCSPASSARA